MKMTNFLFSLSNAAAEHQTDEIFNTDQNSALAVNIPGLKFIY
jgi:hypothetical protein